MRGHSHANLHAEKLDKRALSYVAPYSTWKCLTIKMLEDIGESVIDVGKYYFASPKLLGQVEVCLNRFTKLSLVGQLCNDRAIFTSDEWGEPTTG